MRVNVELDAALVREAQELTLRRRDRDFGRIASVAPALVEKSFLG